MNIQVIYGDYKMANYKEYRHRSAGDKDYKKPHSEGALRDIPGSFISKWGMLAVDLAREENVSCATIHMRVKNYGTPFQRKAKPSICEQLHYKTEAEVALEIDIHPQSIKVRLKKYADAYHESSKTHGNRGAVLGSTDWRQSLKVKNSVFWLHPLHPDYPIQRALWDLGEQE